MKSLTIVLLSLATAFAAQAQNLTVKGVVFDEADQPMIAAGVVQKGTTNGTVTDLDGRFSLVVPKGATVVFSTIGYLNKEVVVENDAPLVIKLEADTQMLEETVVIGYGVQKKSDLTGAISQVKSEDIANRTIASPEQALQGKTAGVQAFASSAAPGATPAIRVRGISSNNDANPLYVVDGRITTSIAGIDPNDIESMEVLKDGASAAIYGAEAGNGVVMITTRRGKGDGKISYSYQLSSQSLGRTPQVMNAEQYLQFYLEKGSFTLNDVYTKWDQKTNTDWINESYENSFMHHHNVTFQAGNDKGSLYISGSYLDNNGMFVGDADVYNRVTGMVNGSWKFKPWLEIQSNNQIEYYKARAISEGSDYGSAVLAALQLDPMTPAYYELGQEPDFIKNYLNQGKALLTDELGRIYGISQFLISENVNPLVQRDRSYSISKGFNINGSTALNIKPFRDLTITSRLGYRLSAGDSYGYSNDYFVNDSYAHQYYMSVSASANNGVYYQWENFANWMHMFGKHVVTAMAGVSYSQNRSYGSSSGISGSDNGGVIDFGLKRDDPLFYYISQATPTATKSVGGGVESFSRKYSYFGRVGWNYMNRYNVQATLRADAADLSVLPKPMRWGYFPSVSAGWTISEEPFFTDFKSWLPFVKLRLSWGQNGSIAGLGGYQYANDIVSTGQYPTGAVKADGSFEYIIGYAPSASGNQELKWETSEQFNVGLDLRFLRDRLAVTVDWFDKATKDLIVTGVTTSTIVGIGASPLNAGNIDNKGLEIEVRWKDQVGDFFYGVAANFSTLKNEVTYLHPTLKDGIGGTSVRNYGSVTRFEKGYPAWHLYGYEYVGVKKETGEALFNHYLEDGTLDSEPTTAPSDSDRRHLGSGIPTYNYGLTLNAGWKGLDFLVFLTGAGGNQILNALCNVDYPTNRLTFLTKDRWTADNPNGTMPAAKAPNYTQFLVSSGVVFDADYLKIKQIQLGYNLPKNLLRKVLIDQMRIYASLDDWFTFTKYPGFDPEIIGQGYSMGVDKGNYPTSKKMVFGVNLTF
ncbi:MAG: SusC/RagA family TonB-linked outer membrane protein [Bacteroidales bacterium]|nr:SusC/RagA family TonB-linked outer membrane protein [Bacteroidales bacterium]